MTSQTVSKERTGDQAQTSYHKCLKEVVPLVTGNRRLWRIGNTSSLLNLDNTMDSSFFSLSAIVWMWICMGNVHANLPLPQAVSKSKLLMLSSRSPKWWYTWGMCINGHRSWGHSYHKNTCVCAIKWGCLPSLYHCNCSISINILDYFSKIRCLKGLKGQNQEYDVPFLTHSLLKSEITKMWWYRFD